MSAGGIFPALFDLTGVVACAHMKLGFLLMPIIVQTYVRAKSSRAKLS